MVCNHNGDRSQVQILLPLIENVVLSGGDQVTLKQRLRPLFRFTRRYLFPRPVRMYLYLRDAVTAAESFLPHSPKEYIRYLYRLARYWRVTVKALPPYHRRDNGPF